MSKVTVELSMSLDGFIAGPNDGPEIGLNKRLGLPPESYQTNNHFI